jgi:hypothetical protein
MLRSSENVLDAVTTEAAIIDIGRVHVLTATLTLLHVVIRMAEIAVMTTV